LLPACRLADHFHLATSAVSSLYKELHGMNRTLLNKATHQFEDVMVPARKLQGAFVNHMERVTRFQLVTMRQYMDLGIRQMRTMQSMDDPRAFMNSNADLLKSLNANLTRDMTEFTRLQRNFAEELQGVGRESSEKLSKLAEAAVGETSRYARDTTLHAMEHANEISESASASSGDQDWKPMGKDQARAGAGESR